MRDIKYLIGMALVAGFCFTANAATNPDPFNIKRAPVQNVLPSQAAAPAPAVQAVVAAPTTMDEIQSWLNTVFGGGIFGTLLTMLFRKSGLPVAGVPAIPSGVATVLNKLKDPDTMAGLEALGLRVVQSGIPGMGIQTAAGVLNPAAGAAAVALEPKVRQVVIDILKDLIDKRTP